jgi:four helix bundle protein
MASFKKFEEMDIWQRSMDLICEIYKETNLGQFSKDYSLVKQIRRAAISIPSNISEGLERDGNRELVNFLYIAKGSCGEIRCQLHIAFRLSYMEKDRFEELYNLAVEISRSLNKLIKYIQDSDFKGKKYHY